MKINKQRELVKVILIHLAILSFVLFSLVPVVWIISTSFKFPRDILTVPPRIVFSPTLANYKSVILGVQPFKLATPLPVVRQFPKYVLNSIIVCTTSSLIGLVIGLPAAYVFARFKFKGKKNLVFYILTTRMLPPVAVAMPFYLIYNQLHLLDTRIGLVIIYLTFNIPIVVWMTKGIIQAVPVEIEEASFIDGCSRMGAFMRVTLPIALPGIIASFIFCLIISWNEFMLTLILTGNEAKTAAVAIYSFISYREVAWGSVSAAGVVVMLPVLILALLIQKHLGRGFSGGAIK